MYDSIFMKILALILLLFIFNGCLQGTALLGPAVTIAGTGNIYQAGLSYGSNVAVKKISGKSTVQNIQQILMPKKNDNKTISIVKKNSKSW
jgi:hypothetical protein